jgi:NAD(P)-dependent dehydrogenase (short-subunit alcohol dehydrogenase family)
VARVFITGSTDGLGRMAAELLIDQGHQVVLRAGISITSSNARRIQPPAIRRDRMHSWQPASVSRASRFRPLEGSNLLQRPRRLVTYGIHLQAGAFVYANRGGMIPGIGM